jgi:hypothetical protein
MNTHPLHVAILELLNKSINCGKDIKIYPDSSCLKKKNKNKMHVSLFLGNLKKRTYHFCDVDLLITHNDKIKIIIEIEESGRQPVKIFGKVFTSAMATHFIHHKIAPDGITKHDKVLFIQVIDSSKLKENGYRKKQWEEIRKLLENIVNNKSLKDITQYEMFIGKGSEFKSDSKSELGNKLTACVKKFLNIK